MHIYKIVFTVNALWLVHEMFYKGEEEVFGGAVCSFSVIHNKFRDNVIVGGAYVHCVFGLNAVRRTDKFLRMLLFYVFIFL